MVWWLKWLGGGGEEAPSGQHPGPPKLDSPEVTAQRVARNAAKKRAEWAALVAQDPTLRDHKISRPDVVAVLRASGYRAVRFDGESVFLKSLGDIVHGLFPSLRTLSGSEIYAPSQRLHLMGYVSLGHAARVQNHLMPSKNPAPSTARVPEVRRAGFVLGRGDIVEALEEIEMALQSVDNDAALALQRAIDPR